MLVDPGSELTFISRSLVKQLQLPRQSSTIPILGIGGSHSGQTCGAVSEEVPSSPANLLTPEEADCEAHFKATHSRDPSGRYIVRLPFKSPATQLGNSQRTAQACLQRLLRRFSSDEPYRLRYSSFMREYEELRHIVRTPLPGPDSTPVYYLPHHGVLKGDDIRVVFNGSSVTSTGLSLNDLLHTGAKLQSNISDVLLWIRQHRYIFITDIRKMFPHHGHLRHQISPILGDPSSLPLVEDEGTNYPLAVDPLLKGRYVDDTSGDPDTFEKLVATALQLVDLCKAGGFPLAKWQSNHPRLCEAISSSTGSPTSHSFSDGQGKILGITWQSEPDQFTFLSRPPTASPVTKRTILSEVAQLFDPLGFLSPVTIRAKMLLQELWLEKIDWDEPLTPLLRHRWTQFRKDLSRITVPRWLGLAPSAHIEIHGFSDASQLAMAAAVFIKVTLPSAEPTITLVCAKTKVAPLKRLTIPRLELTAALLLARLVNYVQRTLGLTMVAIFLWIDSSAVRTWINSHPSR
ncbi:uncharacterized protein [Temnothorax nylanderi]|uniref:uncharacterized protein n=1 Tax=Temnothorax nylanderi TaxID=102681 RepID=UPI003A85674B